MNINAVIQQISNSTNAQACAGMTYQGVQFEEIMKRQQIQTDIAAHLAGRAEVRSEESRAHRQ